MRFRAWILEWLLGGMALSLALWGVPWRFPGGGRWLVEELGKERLPKYAFKSGTERKGSSPVKRPRKPRFREP